MSGIDINNLRTMVIETMTCTCSTPNQSCPNARPRIIGHYCSLLVPPSTPTEIGKLRIGAKFYFDKTPYKIHTLFADFGTYLVYVRPDGWLIQERDLKRVVNLITK